MDNCVFCQIVNGTIPSDSVYEDEQFLAFLDINPVQAGHLLLIPKEHFPMIVDTPDEVVARSFVLAKKLMIAMKTALNSDFVMISVVGTDVSHFHIQLIPRTFGDGFKGKPTVSYQPGQAAEVANAIKKELF